MKVHDDPEVDAMHVVLSEAPAVESEQVRPGLVLDYDARGRLVGMEILNVGKNLPDAELKRLEVEVA